MSGSGHTASYKPYPYTANDGREADNSTENRVAAWRFVVRQLPAGRARGLPRRMAGRTTSSASALGSVWRCLVQQ